MKYASLFFALLSGLLLTACSEQSVLPVTLPVPVVSTSVVVDTSQNSGASMEATPQPTQTKQPTPTLLLIPTAMATPTLWRSMPLMGAEPHHPESDSVLSLLSDSGAQIVRYNGVVWYTVEPQEGEYNWAALRKLDIALQELAARDIDVILIVRGTPGWAQKVYGSACGPIAQEKFASFANFVTELVKRYSAPPYNVKYWEFGNEPDVAPELVSAASVFGCWGDSQDVFYGGGYYAEMLKTVYPAVKAADPEAQVLIGGLLLDCDPEFPPDGKTCHPARFFEGILANDGANYFDIVSFHGYPHYGLGSLFLDWDYPSWNVRGGVIVGKINYLRHVMRQYGVDKPIFLTESSLICSERNIAECRPPDDLFFDKQADYLVRLFVRNWALDVAGTIWYQFEDKGWRYCGMVGADPNNPNPAYVAFDFMNEKLAGMGYTGEVPLPDGVAGYIFEGNDRQTWVLWSQDESPQTIELPSGIFAAYNKLGQQIHLQSEQMTITSPIYLDLSP